jgi:hypothetical protein
MSETSYWYLAVAPLSIPYRTEVAMCETEVSGELVVAPMLFTTRENAETELRLLREEEADAYLRARDEYGEKNINEALDNTPEKRVFEIDSWLLGEHLKDSDLMYVMVDDRLRLAWELSEGLRE